MQVELFRFKTHQDFLGELLHLIIGSTALMYLLVQTDFAIQNGHFWLVLPLEDMIFHSYVNVYQRGIAFEHVDACPRCPLPDMAVENPL